MATQSFKDLLVWQRATEASIEVYKTFKTLRDYFLQGSDTESGLVYA